MTASPFAFARISGDDKRRFLRSGVSTAYRLIVRGVPGDFTAGFTDFVVCRDSDGWYPRRFTSAEIVTSTRFNTRSDCAHHLTKTMHLRGNTQLLELLDLARRDGAA